MKESDIWRFDKRIPLTVVVMLGVQLVMLIYWASYLSARVDYIEKSISTLPRISEQLAHIEERVEYIREEVRRKR